MELQLFATWQNKYWLDNTTQNPEEEGNPYLQLQRTYDQILEQYYAQKRAEQEEKELEFCEEWLTLKKYYFKILTMVTVLADNQKAFRGKLKDLCNSLDIQSSSANIQKIRESINFLAENDYIEIIYTSQCISN